MTNSLLFLHGFTSGGNCEIALTLKEVLDGEITVTAPDLPIEPFEALELVTHICHETRPSLIVGSSCGAFYGQMLAGIEGIPALLVNPFFKMSEFLSSRLGKRQFKCRRADGQQDYEVTPALIERYEAMEAQQFSHYNPDYRDRVWGLFGNHDTLAHFREQFSQYYSVARSFEGGHTMAANEVKATLVPTIREMFAALY